MRAEGAERANREPELEMIGDLGQTRSGPARIPDRVLPTQCLALNFEEAFASGPVAGIKGEGDKNKKCGQGGETDFG